MLLSGISCHALILEIMKMAKDQKQDYSDEFEDIDDFMEDDLDDAYDLDFNDNRITKRQYKARNSRNARRRLEDYFERKALIEDEWDYDY